MAILTEPVEVVGGGAGLLLIQPAKATDHLRGRRSQPSHQTGIQQIPLGHGVAAQPLLHTETAQQLQTIREWQTPGLGYILLQPQIAQQQVAGIDPVVVTQQLTLLCIVQQRVQRRPDLFQRDVHGGHASHSAAVRFSPTSPSHVP